jgi:hypothetical protein
VWHFAEDIAGHRRSGVWGFGFWGWRLGVGVCGLRVGVWDLGFRVKGLGCRVWGQGLKVKELRFVVLGYVLSGLGFVIRDSRTFSWDLGLGFRVSREGYLECKA